LWRKGTTGLIGNRWNNSLDTYNVALLLPILIFDGSQREGRIAEARSQLRQEALRLQFILNHVKMEVHDAMAAVASTKEQVGIGQAGMRSASKELELARERFAVITVSGHIEVTNALTAMARARENLVEAFSIERRTREFGQSYRQFEPATLVLTAASMLILCVQRLSCPL
jgi:outer membrane protein